jgi:hypothetical protein
VHGEKIQYYPQGIPFWVSLFGLQGHPQEEYPISDVQQEIAQQVDEGAMAMNIAIDRIKENVPVGRASLPDVKHQREKLMKMVVGFRNLRPEDLSESSSALRNIVQRCLGVEQQIHALSPEHRPEVKAFVDTWKLEECTSAFAHMSSESPQVEISAPNETVSVGDVLAELEFRKDPQQKASELNHWLVIQRDRWSKESGLRDCFEGAIKRCKTLL